MSKDLGGVTFNDYSPQVLAEMHDAVLRALERIGEQAEGYAKDLCPVDTGQLRNSISHAVDDSTNSAYIGSNVSYAITVETGAKPFDRKDPSEQNKPPSNLGNKHGKNPQPFLKPAVADHAQTYRNIIEDEMKNG